MLGITLALKYPKIVGLVGALTFPLLRDTTLSTYIEHLDKLGIRYTYLKTENVIIFPNKSKILFRHLEEPEKLKSLNLGFVEVEEMSDIPYTTFLMLLSRLRQKAEPEWQGFRHRLFGHTNPQNSRGWIYQHFKKDPPEGYRRILAPTTQNTHLPDGYLELLRKSYGDNYYRINVLGEDDDDTSGLVTKNFKPDRQVLDTIKIDDRYPIHLTCDFNVDPMCWYIAQVYDGNVFYLHEIVRENTTTDSTAQFVADLLAPYKEKQIIINGDASGNSQTTKGVDYVYIRNCLIRNGFKNIDMKLMNKNPSIEYRIQCWNYMMDTPDKKTHIFIHPQCQWLLYNIETQEIDPVTSKPKKISASKIESDPKAKYLGHPIDAVSYLVCLYFPLKAIHLDDYNNMVDNQRRDVFGGKYDRRLI